PQAAPGSRPPLHASVFVGGTRPSAAFVGVQHRTKALQAAGSAPASPSSRPVPASVAALAAHQGQTYEKAQEIVSAVEAIRTPEISSPRESVTALAAHEGFYRRGPSPAEVRAQTRMKVQQLLQQGERDMPDVSRNFEIKKKPRTDPTPAPASISVVGVKPGTPRRGLQPSKKVSNSGSFGTSSVSSMASGPLSGRNASGKRSMADALIRGAGLASSASQGGSLAPIRESTEYQNDVRKLSTLSSTSTESSMQKPEVRGTIETSRQQLMHAAAPVSNAVASRLNHVIKEGDEHEEQVLKRSSGPRGNELQKNSQEQGKSLGQAPGSAGWTRVKPAAQKIFERKVEDEQPGLAGTENSPRPARPSLVAAAEARRGANFLEAVQKARDAGAPRSYHLADAQVGDGVRNRQKALVTAVAKTETSAEKGVRKSAKEASDGVGGVADRLEFLKGTGAMDGILGSMQKQQNKAAGLDD
ncbi:unnamed protein product, partial [Amoebophrya sp. A25]